MRVSLLNLVIALCTMQVLMARHAAGQGLGDINVTVGLNNGDIKTLFKKIEKQTNLRFAYDPTLVQAYTDISLPRDTRSIKATLDLALEGTPLRYRQMDNSVIIYSESGEGNSQVNQQDTKLAITVSGTVTGSAQQPLPGVNIIVKGTTNGTTTDSEGRYSLSVSEEDAVLVFSFIGYITQEMALNGRSVIDVALVEDIQSLEEVVVIGYGTVERKDLTGAVGSVNNKEIKDLAVTRVDQALLGKVAGVQVKPVSGEPGAAPQIRIRGIGSISAGGDPLYVVDGFPVASIQTLNPNDIESIDVLKDASATAIYGSRGANGVIIINTKRGKVGKSTISYDTYFGFQKASKIPVFMTGREQAQHYFDGIRNRNIDEGNDVSIPVSQWKIAVPITLIEVLEGRSPTMPGVTLEFQDHIDAVLRTAPQQQHQLSASGGTENLKYALSGEYLNQEGIIIQTNFKRYSLRANIDTKLSERLSVKLNLNPSFTDKNNVGGMGFDDVSTNTDILYNAIVIPPYYTLYDKDGSYFPFGGGLDAVVTTQNPLALANEIIANQKGTAILGNINAEYTIFDELKLNILMGVNLMNAKGMRFKPQLPSFFNNPAVGTDNASMLLNWLTEYSLNYNRSFGNHNISGLVGYTVQKETFQSNFLTSNRYPNNLVPTLSAVSGIITNGSSNKYEWSLLSYLGRFNYSYYNKYYLTASIRTDGSSRFGADNKYGVFPSLALAWRISDEDFLKDAGFLTELKLRTSYGKTGNNNIGNYDHYATINYEKYPLGGSPIGGYAPGRLANPSLTWETQQQINAGIDAAFFDGRVAVTVDHFLSRNTNLLLNVNVPDITGFSNALKNIGEVKNSGWEFVLNTVNLKDQIRWSTDYNLSTYRNEVVKLGPEGDPIISGGNITMIGQPVGMFFGWLTDGIFMTQAELDAGPLFNPGARDASRVGDVRFVDVSGPEGIPDGIINSFDKTIMGSPYPDFYYGMTNNFSYKNLSLSIGLQGSHGNEILALSRGQVANNRARFRQLAILNNYWKSEEEPGDGQTPRPNDTPTGNFRGVFSQRWLDKGSYLRINNITLAYNLPEKVSQKLMLSSTRVYVNATNPFLFTKHVGWNPDVSRSNNPLTPGNERYDYPLPKSFIIGLNVTF